MKITAILIGGAILGGLKGLVDTVYAIKHPDKTPAQRRAEREDCRKKGL